LDGGRGQLNVAQEVFKELQIKEVDMISLAKERVIGKDSFSPSRKSEEKIFHLQYKEPLILGRHSPLLHLLDRIRDEAHRFAITFHKKMRAKGTIRSELGEIPNIGSIRQKALIKYFGSIDNIKKAPAEELAKAPKMNLPLAQRIYIFFHSELK
jgi:excinuclease ABC subunit C